MHLQTNKWTLKTLDSNFNTNSIDIDNFLMHNILRLVIFKKLFERSCLNSPSCFKLTCTDKNTVQIVVKHYYSQKQLFSF